jgi:hypothetical protein
MLIDSDRNGDSMTTDGHLRAVIERLSLRRRAEPGTPVGEPLGLDGGRVPNDLEVAIQQMCGQGQPLDHALLRKLSTALNHDFSGVRIHAGPKAEEFNRRLGASAFTVGSDIFFGRDAYDPETREGLRLIAHELVHVRQQSAGHVEAQRAGFTVLPSNDPSEAEADIVAMAVLNAEETSQQIDFTPRHTHPFARVVQRNAVLIQAANNQVHQLTEEGAELKPRNCHEAVLGWLLTSLNYPRRWRLLRLAAAQYGQGGPAWPQFTGPWMWEKIYNPRQLLSRATLANAQPGDVLCSGNWGNVTHSMVVVSRIGNAVNIRGFNNAGTFGHHVPPPLYMEYDAQDRDVAAPDMWGTLGLLPGKFGPAGVALFLVQSNVARQNVARAFPWENSPFPVNAGQRWHYNPLQGWRWF